MSGGHLVTADINYRPSLMFWLLVILDIFLFIAYIGVLGLAVSIFFYFWGKKNIKERARDILDNVKMELEKDVIDLNVNDDKETESKLLLEVAKKTLKEGKKTVAVAVLEHIETTYPGTGSAKIAVSSLNRYRSKA